MFSLQNKITIVTGAGSGIGAAIADAFAELGTPDQVRRVFVEFQKHLYPTGPIPVGVRGHPSTAS